MIVLQKKIISLVLVLVLPLVQCLSAKEALTEIPFELYGNHIFIKLKVNQSEPLHFIFDTGAAATIISQRKAKKLRLKSDGFMTVRNNKGPTIAYHSSDNVIFLENNVKIEDVRISQLELDHLDRVLERRVDGVIGHDLLKHFIVLVNYDNFKLELYDHQNFSPSVEYHKRSFDLIAGRPYIQAALVLENGEILQGKFQLDNGSGSSVTLYSPFVDQYKIHSKIRKTDLVYTMGFTGIVDRNYAGRLPAFDVGAFQITNLPIRLNQSLYFKKAFKDGVGHIGNALLKRFNIAFDYKNKVSYWKPNQSFVEEFRETYSGLIVKADNESEKVYIKHVFDNSPAALAGLAENDEIIMINNIRTTGRTSFEVNNLLNSDQQFVEIVIKRNEELKKLNLQLKTL